MWLKLSMLTNEVVINVMEAIELFPGNGIVRHELLNVLVKLVQNFTHMGICYQTLHPGNRGNSNA